MKHSVFSIFFFILLNTISLKSEAQEHPNSGIVGTWKFDKITFESPTSDSSDIKNGWTETIISIETNGKFTSQKEIKGKSTVIASGNYKISEDKKYLYQDEMQSEIVLLTKKQLVIKTQFLCTIYFTRVEFRYSSSYNGTVINSKTSEPVPYVAIGLIKANTGMNADENGRFLLNTKAYMQDTVLLSCVGYEPLKISLNNLPINGLISLQAKVTTLKEVVVSNLHNTKDFILNKFSGIGFDRFIITKNASQVAQPIYCPVKDALLTEIHIYKSHEKALFRVRLYAMDSITKKPSTDLADTVIEINSVKSNVHINMRKYGIRIPQNNFFIAIEWLKIPYNEYQFNTSLQGRKFTETRHSPSIIFGRKAENIDQIPWYLDNSGWIKIDYVGDVFRISATVEY